MIDRNSGLWDIAIQAQAISGGAATVSFESTTGAWLVTGVKDDGYGHQERFHGEDGRARAMAHAIELFKTVTVVEQV